MLSQFDLHRERELNATLMKTSLPRAFSATAAIRERRKEPVKMLNSERKKTLGINGNCLNSRQLKIYEQPLRNSNSRLPLRRKTHHGNL